MVAATGRRVAANDGATAPRPTGVCDLVQVMRAEDTGASGGVAWPYPALPASTVLRSTSFKPPQIPWGSRMRRA